MRFIRVSVDQILKRRIPKWIGACLLGVLAFLVLVAVLTPTCGCTGREGARDAACVSNERQLGLGLLQYAQDNDGYLPAGIHGKGIGWAGQV